MRKVAFAMDSFTEPSTPDWYPARNWHLRLPIVARARSRTVQMKLELVPVPVSDVDRAKAFYVEKIGFNPDHDHRVSDEVRFVQLTPPGSACSIAIGTGLTEMAPGSIKGLQMVVEDAQAAHDELAARGVEVSDVQVLPWGSFVLFSDPDGNTWSLQQLPPRDDAPE
jgi:catechol 2,3-dioxygenase-like lactoylglutathione lyase family enzyme